jgi:N-acetylmuramoyl-L-alanine amidase
VRLVDQRRDKARELEFGARMLGAAALLAGLIVLLRLAFGGGDETPVASAPAITLITPAPPAAPLLEASPVAPAFAATAPAAPAPAATAPPPPPTTVPDPPAPTAAAEPLGMSGQIVCIDPGHGGADLGNVRIENGTIALREKDFTLAHSLELGRRLEARGLTVVFTRTSDIEANPDNRDVNGDGIVAAEGGEANSDQLDDLQARVLICNEAGADVLVSVHYNGAENEFLEGYEVWYNDEREFADQNARLARLTHTALGEAYAAAGYDAFDKGIGIEAHAVTGPARPGKLTPSEMPGIVVEGLFLSNEDDAAFIQSPIAEDTIVGAYEKAIVQFLEEQAT